MSTFPCDGQPILPIGGDREQIETLMHQGLSYEEAIAAVRQQDRVTDEPGDHIPLALVRDAIRTLHLSWPAAMALVERLEAARTARPPALDVGLVIELMSEGLNETDAIEQHDAMADDIQAYASLQVSLYAVPHRPGLRVLSRFVGDPWRFLAFVLFLLWLGTLVVLGAVLWVIRG